MKTSTNFPCRFSTTLLLFFLFASLKMMAQPVYDNNGISANATSINSFNVPAGNDRLLVVCTVNGTNSAVPTVTIGVNPMNLAKEEFNNNGLKLAMYYLVLGSGPGLTGTITATGSAVYRVGASSYHNVKQTSPFDGETSQTIAGGATSSTLSINSTANDLVCDCIGFFAVGFTGFTANPSQTQVFNGQFPSPVIGTAMSTKAGTSPSVSMNWSLNGSTSGGGGAHIGLNLKSASCPTTGTIWYVDASAASGGNGASWECAFQNVQDAITAASSGHEVWVKAGTYLPTKDPFGNASPSDPRDKTFYMKNGVAIYGGFAGTETMRSQRNPTTNLTTLSGDIGTSGDNTDNCYHVVLSVSDANTAVLDGFTVSGGNATGSGNITVETKLVTKNYGGGLYCWSSLTTVANCTFTGNQAENGAGMSNVISNVTITACNFTGNTLTPSGNGGGVMNNGSNPTITNCTFSGNSGTNGGEGGAISNFGSSSPIVSNCTFQGNSIGGSGVGGAVSHNSNSSPIYTNCLFSGNGAGSGGGMSNNSANPTILNCTFSGNTASSNGGAIYNNASTVGLTNCIIWNNRSSTTTGSANASIYNLSSTPVITYSLVQNITDGTNNNLDGITPAAQSNYPNFVTPLDPATAPSAGGDFHIQGYSPVANVGTATGAPATDLFGNARPFGAAVDLGVHELQAENVMPCPAVGSIWYVDASAASGGNGASWACAFQDFQSAVAVANAGDTVLVAEGTYKPSAGGTGRQKRFILGEGVSFYGGFPNGGGNFASRDFTNNRTILSGDIGVQSDSTDNCYTVVDATNLTNATLMSGFTVERGNADSIITTVIFGRTGGIYLGNTGNMRLDSVTIRNNFGRVGSAIYAGQPVSWQVRGCSISQNNGSSAIIIGGTASGSFLDCDFDSNTAGNGSAINFNVTSGTFSITNCDFTNNKATSSGGGGAINAGASVNTFTDCNFLNNQATLGNGGAVYKFNSTSSTFVSCLFQGNKAASSGGGAAFSAQGGYTFRQCRFIQNQTTAGNGHGGAVYSNGGSSTFENCLFWSNSTTTGLGGAIYNNTGGTANITNCTFNNNNAGGFSQGGGLNNNSNSNANIMNSIFWGNKANGNDVTADSEIGHGSGTLTVNHTVWQGATPSGTTYAFDPLFTNAATGDLTLTSCSPAIDTGSVAGAPTVDLIGATRPFDARPGSASLDVDLGAYELQSSATINPTTANAGSDQSGCVNNSFTLAANTPSVGIGMWSVVSGPSTSAAQFGNTSSPTSTFTAAGGTGTYTLRWTISNAPCTASSDDVVLTFNLNPTTANAGPDQNIPLGTNQTTLAANAPAVGTGAWSVVNGTGGSFGNATSPTSTFDGTTGETYLLRWTISNSPCNPSTDDVQIAFSSCPTAGSIWFVDASAASGGTGTSWDCAFQNVQDAINAASSGHEIWVKAGTYLPIKDPFGNASPTDQRDKVFYLKAGVALYGGFDGTETMRSQRNWTANVTILSGDIGTSGDDADNSYHVVLSINDSNSTVLDGFSIEKGKADGTGTITVESRTIYREQGAGLYSLGASLTIANCIFTNNSASGIAGGMYYGLGSSSITGCTFSNNSAAYGGGFVNTFAGSPTLTNCIFSSNTVSNLGGGVYEPSSAPAASSTFINCAFTNNTADVYGGGYYTQSSTSSLTNCTFTGNSSTTFHGGGIYSLSATIGLANCIFSNNSAANLGGGIYNTNSTFTMTNCSFSGNVATSGGGVYNAGVAQTYLTNCTISGNKSTGNNGGGMYNSNSNPTLTNCIIWNNRGNTSTGSANANLFNISSTPVITYSLIQNHNPSGMGNLDGITPAAQSNYPNFVTPLDPATAPSTGGDFHITDCSPVLNVGDNSAAPATDLFGNNRPFGTTVDLGVHELQSAPTTPVAICQNTSVNLDGTGNATLIAANLNNGSTGCDPLSFSASPNTFNCTNLGANTVTLTVTGANNTTSTCMATVTVTDNLPPNALCRDFVKNLGTNGTVSITAAEVDNLSTDNCGTVNLVSAVPSSFNCSNIGVNDVTLTVNDGHGNQSTCVGHVTISDATPPTAICQNIGVNLELNGMASITAAQVNNGSIDNCGIASLSVSPNSFTCSNIGNQSVTLTVTDNANLTNTCNATVTVSDATAPTSLCQNISVNLGSNGTASITGAQVNNGSNDNCGIASLSVLPNSFNCSNIGNQSVTLTVTDNSNLTSTCMATVTVSDATAPNAVCQSVTINLDGNGNASITGGQVDGGSTDNCGIASLSVSPNTFDINDVGQNSVTLTVTDNNSLTATCMATVTVTNTNAPNAVCQPYTAVLDVNGSVSITPADVDGGSTAVGGIASLSVLPNTLNCSNLGTNSVTLTVVGNNSQQATCQATVTVQDNTPPTVACQNISVNLSGNTATITPSQVFNVAGSSDNCGAVNPANVSPNTFNCSNLGANNVTLTADDGNGNDAICTATVTVNDNTQPTVVCQNISVNLSAGGTASITASQVFNAGASGDNCGTVNLVNVLPNSFTCSDLGANNVTLTANDGHGNQATCNATVTVIDNLPPSALCRDIVVQLDQNGNASITASQVNNGSTDNCGLGTLTVSPNTFTLANVGINSVTLTVPDVNGNSATCNANVTVENNQLPNAVCKNISRNLDINGEVHLTAADVDDGSSALGGIAIMSVSPDLLTCSELGQNTVTLTIVGNNNQQASCNATVTVSDATAPTLVCQNISIAWNGGTNTIAAADVYNAGSSSDNCGMINLVSVSPSAFTCSNLGSNTVTLTVNDGHGNEATCEATVTLTGSAPIWYADTDSDGYGDPMVTQSSCTQPSGYVSDNTDCNDMDPAVNPATVWYKDGDGDGYSDGTTQVQCAQPMDYDLASNLTATSGDCDDSDPAINPATVWYKDGDGDGYSDGTTQVQCAQPMGYDLASNLTAISGDCDDSDGAVNPAATEVCNGVDDNCNMEVDEGAASPATWYADSDNDGFGDPMVTQSSCTQPSGYVSDNTDCNDSEPAINPTTVWYKDGDGDGYSDGMTQVQCTQPMDYDLANNLTATSGDCDDSDGSVNPSATEVCNGIDDNCNMEVDEGAASPATWYADSDNDGFGDPMVTQSSCTQPSGYVSDNTDCDDSDPAINPTTVWYKDGDGDGYSDGTTQVQCAQPMGYDLANNLTATSGDCDDSNGSVNPSATEVCNGIDDNCNMEVDEGAASPATWYADSDNDGFGDPMVTQSSCTQPSGYVSDNTDCDDSDPAINPTTVWYKDADGDGYSDGMTQVQCAQPMGYDLASNLLATSGDCDDSDGAVNPSATEVCNGVDDNCNMEVDEGAANPSTWYADSDNDGFGDPLVSQSSCTQPSGYVADNTDCDDSDPAINPATVWYKDGDGDGYSDGMTQIQCAKPMGYDLATNLTANSGDCDDSDGAVNPSATEVCNGVDDNCNMEVDEGAANPSTWYADSDNDGFGDPMVTQESCTQPSGYVSDNTDCNDSDPAVNSSATEVCNGVDDDCANGIDDGLTFNDYYFDGDGDGYGTGPAVNACEWPGAGYVLQNGDCDDNNILISPSMPEVCNGIDDDCSGLADDGLIFNNYYFDGDGDGYGAGSATTACEWPGTGYVLQNGDCNDGNPAIYPGANEVCNGIDDDCANGPDDGLTFNDYYFDGDGDGYGSGPAVNACEWPGAGYVLQNGDCDDNNMLISPSMPEVCNGIDDDCSGLADDGLTFNNYYFDGDGDGYGAGSATNACEWPGTGYVLQNGDCNDSDLAINPGATETCDGVDNNCNILVDGNDPTLVDNDPPAVTCKNIIVTLDGQANATISPNDVFEGGSDNCGSVTPISVSPSMFTCADEGDNLVTLTVNDGNGNANNCSAMVTVLPFLTDPVVTTMGETCPGMGNGTITISASAPSGQVRYSINGGLSFSASGMFANLSPGTYNIVVKVFGIANVCEKTATATVGSGGSSTTWFKDMDGDGYTDGVTYVGCTPPANYLLSALPGDCDDNDPHEFPGQVWWRDMDNDNYSNGTSVIACQRPIGHKTVAELASTETDCNDGNTAVHPNATEICDGIDNDCDAEIDEGLLDETYVGNVQFSTQAQVDNWSACYTKVQGFVSIIGTGITDLEPLVNIKEITGNLTIQSTGLVSKVGLDSLTDVGGTLTIFFNSTLTSLNGLSKLDTVGGAFYMYYNFQLSDCCPVKDLLNGGVAGPIVVFYNKVGCNSVQEINNTCVPASIVGGNSGNVLGSAASQMAALEKVSVFPNPTNGSFSVSVPDHFEAGKIVVLDITGRPVLRMNLVSGRAVYRFEDSDLTAGIYLVQVKPSGHPSQAIRLMIE